MREAAGSLIGQDPSRVEDIWQAPYRGRFYRRGPILMSAIAGIDQALWDIKGKLHGLPVHEFLGGLVRDRMRVYAWIGGDTPAEAAREARERVGVGCTAVKMNATSALHYVDTSDRIVEVIARVGAVRDAVGDGIGIAIDFHGRLHRAMAKALAKELEPAAPAVHRGVGLARERRGPARGRPAHRRPHRRVSGSIRAGSSRSSCRTAASTSSSRTSRTLAAFPRSSASRPWPRPTTWPWRRTARSGLSRWAPACRSTPARQTR